MRAVVILISLCLAAQAAAQQPLPKRGPCPSGYWNSGDFCTPAEDAAPAIPRHGSCPGGYWSSGDYCVGDRRDAKPAVANPKGGSCPSGWRRSGGACVKH
jgi:hypothetical protein